VHPLLPLSALLAEIEAFPFASEPAHQLRITQLTLGDSGVLDGDSERLGTPLLERLLSQSGGMSFASLRLLIEHAWFGESEESIASADPAASIPIPGPRVLSLAQYAGGLASRYLELAGNRVQLHASVNRPERAESFRWLTLYLPQDFLIAALAARADLREPPPDSVRLVSPQLAEVLQQGCAETHLHRGAALPFSTLWSGLVKSLSRPDSVDFSRLRATQQEGTPHSAPQPGGSPEQLELFLLAAAITRILLAAYLLRYEANGPARSFCPVSAGHRTRHAERDLSAVSLAPNLADSQRDAGLPGCHSAGSSWRRGAVASSHLALPTSLVVRGFYPTQTAPRSHRRLADTAARNRRHRDALCPPLSAASFVRARFPRRALRSRVFPVPACALQVLSVLGTEAGHCWPRLVLWSL
jgi:hypothetical protein